MTPHRWNAWLETLQADDTSWLHADGARILRGDLKKLRSLSDTLVKQQSSEPKGKRCPRARLACGGRIYARRLSSGAQALPSSGRGG